MDPRAGSGLTWWRWLGWIITAAALWFVARWLLQVDHQVWSSIRHLRFGWLMGSLVIFQVWFLLRFAAWEVIVKRHGSSAQRHQTLRAWTVSELMRYIPGNLWSFAGKYRSSVSTGTTTGGAIQSMAIEAGGLLSGAGLVSALFLDASRWWWSAIIIILLLPPLAPILFRFIGRLAKWVDVPRLNMTETIGLILWYAVVWVMFGLATAMIYWSFPEAVTITLTRLIGINVAAWLIGYLSIITPMGLGVRELAFVKLTAGLLSNGLASLVALVTRLWFVLSELIFLFLVLIWSAIKRS